MVNGEKCGRKAAKRVHSPSEPASPLPETILRVVGIDWPKKLVSGAAEPAA